MGPLLLLEKGVHLLFVEKKKPFISCCKEGTFIN